MIKIVGTQLRQWDVGRSVTIDVADATHVHFANKGDSLAPIIELTDGKATIPQYLLETGKDLLVHAVREIKTDGVVAERTTLEIMDFPVEKRPRPDDYIYGDDRRNYVYQLITDAENAVTAANTAANGANAAAGIATGAAQNADQVAQDLLAAKERGEFDGPQGEQGPQGIQGPKGDPGESPADAVLFSEQELDEDQKKQARKNIGAVGKGEDVNLDGHRVLNASKMNFDTLDQIVPIARGGISIANMYGFNVIFTGVEDGTEDNDAVNMGQFKAAFGDVEGALDGIIAIQNELIGGDA